MRKMIKSGIAIILAIMMFASVPAFAGRYAEEPSSPFDKDMPMSTNEVTHNMIENLSCAQNTVNLNEIDKEFIPNESLNEIGRISIKNELTVGGIDNPLFCTFDSPLDAMKNIKSMLSELLSLMEETYDLGELSESTWQTYAEYLYKIRGELNDLELTDSTKDDLFTDTVTLEAFFDIYENDSVNDEILQLAEKNRATALSSEETERLILSLPYTSPLVKSYNRFNSSIRSISGFNVSRGVTYAETYAESPNPFYYYFSSDCTNFASQILEAGGVKQTSTWWHTTNGQTHNHSRAWTVANDFGNYWGASYETIDFNNLSSRVRKGDFIAYDAGNDGSWGHIAFVTATGNKTSSGYTDFKVAQHSSDYHEWVSSPDNGWEHLGYIPYAIIG